MPGRDGLRNWKILKKIQLRSDYGVEKLESNCNTPLAAKPDLSTYLNQYYSWPGIHLVVSAGVFHISLRPQKIQPKRWKDEQTNNMDLGQLQAQEREFCVTILFSFSCICRLSWACILRETSTTYDFRASNSEDELRSKTRRDVPNVVGCC